MKRPGDPAPTRFQQGMIDRQVMHCIGNFLNDEHGLRRFANGADARELRNLFEQALVIKVRLSQPVEAKLLLRSLVTAIRIMQNHLEIDLDPCAMGMADQSAWTVNTPLPAKHPFREARLRIDAASTDARADQQLLRLLADAFEVQDLVIASPHLSINQLAKSLGRCRKQMAKLFSISFLSPRIIEAITEDTQPWSINRTRLLEAELPLDWAEQEALLGFAA